ncbi:hypothetical protein LAZ67_1005511 [Cordylochernes scorpioides]|uniref:Uncharacterized protein n=1 Tax=Cordylochernes scorpioides TaxID=51811 RepID=A0ABY6JY47_9ARAC|nr:hypothetical protein LAZ67_1005511 [Cordylochernes scorpioides]
MLFNAVHSVIYRPQAVIENEGCHIEQGLWPNTREKEAQSKTKVLPYFREKNKDSNPKQRNFENLTTHSENQ